MKKILLIDDSDTYTWCLQKYLQHRGYPVKTACTLKEARAAIQEEMPLVVCCNLDLPDGSGMDFLNEVRAAVHRQKEGAEKCPVRWLQEHLHRTCVLRRLRFQNAEPYRKIHL